MCNQVSIYILNAKYNSRTMLFLKKLKGTTVVNIK